MCFALRTGIFPVGLLILLSLLQLPSLAAEVRFIAFAKGSRWLQEGPSAPTLQTANAYEVRALVEPSRVDAVSMATVRGPSPSATTRTLSNRGAIWEYLETFPSQTALNNSAANGTYTFVVQTGLDGRRTNVVTVSADVYPTAPRVANFPEAQAVDSKADFTLRWDPAGTGANGFVQVRIRSGTDTVFQSPTYPQAAGALNGSASSFLIPKNTLREGQQYTGSITIWRKTTEDLTGYPGVSAWGAYTRTTEFPLRTVFGTTDVAWYGFAKVQHYTQTSPNPPGPATGSAFEMLGFADATAATNMSAASIRAANGSVLADLSANAGSWRFTQSFSTETELNARFSSGSYLRMDTVHNGNRTYNFALPPAAWPAAPQFSNFNDANAIDSSKAFTLRWNPLPGATASDFLLVRIKKAGTILLKSPEQPFAPGALNGTATSFDLPPGFLAPGEACEASVLLLKATVTDPYSYPRAIGWCSYGRQTSALIRARGGNVTLPQIRNLRSLPGALGLEFQADAGRQYVLQGSSDFRAWNNLLITNAPGSLFQLQLNWAPQHTHQFLRVVAF